MHGFSSRPCALENYLQCSVVLNGAEHSLELISNLRIEKVDTMEDIHRKTPAICTLTPFTNQRVDFL